MFEKKFEVRIRHWLPDSEYYCIEYTHHRFFRSWTTLKTWLDYHQCCWNPELVSYARAKEIAQSLKSIEDVEAWYVKEMPKRRNCIEIAKRQKEELKRQAPVDVEYF